jgi:hypothetical protein
VLIKINEVTQVVFEIDDKGRIPAGKACRLLEADGCITVLIRPGEAHPELCRQLNEYHRQILGTEGSWAQNWDEQASRVDEAPQGLGIAKVEWRIVPGSELPTGKDCFPLEELGSFVWAIRAGRGSKKLCAEMNAYLARITGDGLWEQRWGGESPCDN